VFSSTKLEIRAEQFLLGSGGDGDEREGEGWGEEMAQTMYAYINK
jgi:hypothetical protein